KNMEDETKEFIDYKRWLKRIETDVVNSILELAYYFLLNTRKVVERVGEHDEDT
ncbi:13928_t:CDS:2, partial [Racocetra persica]